MTALFNRLGNLGILLIASALLIGGLGGAAIAHHYDRLPAKTVASQQHDDQSGAKQKSNKNNKNAKQTHDQGPEE